MQLIQYFDLKDELKNGYIDDDTNIIYSEKYMLPVGKLAEYNGFRLKKNG